MRITFRRSRLGSPFWDYLIAFVPIGTLGMGACAPSLWRGIREGIPRLYWLAAAYAVGSLTFLVVSGLSGWDGGIGALGGGGLLLLGLASTLQALAWTIPGDGPYAQTPKSDDNAITAARAVLDRRREARQIVKTDPELASVLKIGRPGLRREYADGGLVDLNHADAAEIREVLEISEELASEIVATRETIGAFSSLEDLASIVTIEPREIERFRPVALFCP